MVLCERCNEKEAIEDHHISYEDDETVPLCRSCHRQVHADETSPYHPEDEPERSTIAITKEQKKRLDELKTGTDSYIDVLDKLLSEGKIYTEQEIREIAEQVVQEHARR